MYTRLIHTLIGVASSLLGHNIDIHRHLNIVTDADDDEVVFDNYDATTVDTGWLLFIIASVISVLSVALLPLSMRIGRYLSGTHFFCKCKGKSDSTVVVSSAAANSEEEEPPTTTSSEEPRTTWLHKAFAWLLGHLIYRWNKRSSPRKQQHHGDRIEAVKRARSKEKRASILRRIVTDAPHHACDNKEVELSLRALSHDDIIETNQRIGASHFLRSPRRSVVSIAIESVKKRRRRNLPLRRGDQINVFSCNNQWNLFKSIIRFDHETKRILRLAIPFTISAVIYTICDLVIVGFVSQYLGTDAMVAYTIVGLTTGSK